MLFKIVYFMFSLQGSLVAFCLLPTLCIGLSDPG